MEKQQHHKGIFVSSKVKVFFKCIKLFIWHSVLIEEVVNSSLIIYATCSDTRSSLWHSITLCEISSQEGKLPGNQPYNFLIYVSWLFTLPMFCVWGFDTMFSPTFQCLPWQQASVCWVTCPTPPAVQLTAERSTLTWSQVLLLFSVPVTGRYFKRLMRSF